MSKLRILATLALMGAALQTSSAAFSQTDFITPYLGGPEVNYECRSVVVDQSNVVGFLAVPRDEQTMSTKVLYRSGVGNRRLEFTMMNEDARRLRTEIDALMRRLRTKPIRFEAKFSRNGQCRLVQVSG